MPGIHLYNATVFLKLPKLQIKYKYWTKLGWVNLERQITLNLFRFFWHAVQVCLVSLTSEVVNFHKCFQDWSQARTSAVRLDEDGTIPGPALKRTVRAFTAGPGPTPRLAEPRTQKKDRERKNRELFLPPGLGVALKQVVLWQPQWGGLWKLTTLAMRWKSQNVWISVLSSRLFCSVVEFKKVEELTLLRKFR